MFFSCNVNLTSVFCYTNIYKNRKRYHVSDIVSLYLDTESADAYLPRVLADVLEGKLNAFGKRMGHLLFKLSVDQNLMGNILAADIEIDPDELRKARVRCVKEVKETNGEISFEDTVRYQKGAE